ncbi:hypothetical protein DRO03_09350, partial [Methanosarcinales archaeon]
MKKIYVIFLLSILITSAYAQVKMEGFYEFNLGKSYSSEDFKWNLSDPNYYMETKFMANPIKDTSLFLKFYADKDNDNYYNVSNRQEGVFSEANIQFTKQKNGYGFKTTLFSRGGSFYWTDSSLLGILNVGSVNNDNNGQGARLDVWYPFGGSVTYVFSDFSSGEGDDIHLLRLRQLFLNGKISSGIFYQRKSYNTEDNQKNAFNEVVANDYRIKLGKYFISWEYALSRVPSESDNVKKTNTYYDEGIKSYYKANVASKIEVSGFRVGTPTLGSWSFTPGLYSFGDTYRNYMGNDQSNEVGYWINSYYLVPKRAITLTLNYNYSQKIIPDTISTLNGEEVTYNKTGNLYSEIYLEFIKGFKSKISFNKKDENWRGTLYKHYDFFTELSVENKIAKLLTQFKIKDIGQPDEKQIMGIELSTNISDKLRVFSRGMIANDKIGSRHSIFGEIQYRISGNSEVYLQYGPSWWGSYGLVNDDGFASGGNMQKELKLII